MNHLLLVYLSLLLPVQFCEFPWLRLSPKILKHHQKYSKIIKHIQKSSNVSVQTLHVALLLPLLFHESRVAGKVMTIGSSPCECYRGIVEPRHPNVYRGFNIC